MIIVCNLYLLDPPTDNKSISDSRFTNSSYAHDNKFYGHDIPTEFEDCEW